MFTFTKANFCRSTQITAVTSNTLINANFAEPTFPDVLGYYFGDIFLLLSDFPCEVIEG